MAGLYMGSRAQYYRGFASICCAMVSLAFAGEDKPVEPQPSSKEAAIENKSDPTRPSPRLKQLLKKAEQKPVGTETAQPAKPKLPPISIKAIVKAADRPMSAILQVGDKELVSVKAGAELTLKSAEGVSLRLLVKKVSEDGVELEDSEQKATVIAR
jgi:hypothetical protein